MSSRSLPSTGHAAAENELLSQLGLPPSSGPEDVDHLHQAVSDYLAAAPASIRGWAHAQSAALDAAYLQLTDPVGFGGPALRSPTRPPRVEPGGPATPPARRDPLAAAPIDETGKVAEAEETTHFDTDDVEALYASVTPSAHPDMLAKGRQVQPTAEVRVATLGRMDPAGTRKNVRKNRYRVVTAPVATPPASVGRWKWVAILASGALALVLVFGFAVPFVFNMGSATTNGGGGTPQPSASATTVDMQQVAQLMTKLQANPKDTATLQALGDAYYKGGDYTQAGQFYDQVLAIDPKSITALLARGACYFNANDLASAEKSWKLVVSIDPKNQEAHYDLGFLYLNQPSPNWDGVQREWKTVIAIDSTTQLAQTVQQHLDSLAASSMLPASSGAASAAPFASPAPSASPAASPSASTKP